MKNIVITGVSRGLGEGLALHLLSEDPNCRVIGISRSESAQTQVLKRDFSERFEVIRFDMTQAEQIENLYLDKLKPLGPIHALVNNAAQAYDDLMTNANADRLRSMMDVNVVSPILLTKYCVRDMLLHEISGSVVFVSSVSSGLGFKGLSMYAATKGAVESFIKGAAREWGSKGIRFNAVAPGFMETEMTSTLTEEQRQKIYRRTSLRKPTSILSVAKTIQFLLDDSVDCITGETVRVDSGAK